MTTLTIRSLGNCLNWATEIILIVSSIKFNPQFRDLFWAKCLLHFT